MKILKIFLYILIGGLALFFIVAAFFPSKYQVTRSIEINQPVAAVFEQVEDFNEFEKWNPWSAMETGIKHTQSNPAKGVGAYWTWEGNKTGQGKMTIQKVVPNKSIDIKLEFMAPQQSTAQTGWVFEESGKATKVTWSIEGELSYPLERYLGPMIENMLGKDFENGLANLKKKMEDGK